VAFTLNLIALIIVLGLAYVGTIWLAGFVHRSKDPKEETDEL